MISVETKLRVRYGETDQMGYVYYGNYALYYEVGRVELLRDLGTSYKDLEEQGIMLPVMDLSVKYLKPAFYD
ncbi:MAG: acyl-CoA thioester hydrolase, partial [Gammaproteobacteria bacterium]